QPSLQSLFSLRATHTSSISTLSLHDALPIFARCTVARLMKSMGLQGVIRGKPVKTTISDKASPCPLDKVNRQFQAPAPNRLWVSAASDAVAAEPGHFPQAESKRRDMTPAKCRSSAAAAPPASRARHLSSTTTCSRSALSCESIEYGVG